MNVILRSVLNQFRRILNDHFISIEKGDTARLSDASKFFYEIELPVSHSAGLEFSYSSSRLVAKPG